MNCDEARNLSIVDFLDMSNIRPVKRYQDELLYHCPYRKDKDPSFSVNVKKNVWRDSGRNQGGDLILLVCKMYNVSLSEALKILSTKKPQSFSFSVQHDSNNQPIKIRHIQEIQNKALIQYLTSRLISLEIASIYFKEAYYQVNSKQFFALAFKNDKGGYELRNKYFKGCTSPKFLTTIPGKKDSINIFEGSFDFLSALVYYKTNRPTHQTIILNSLSFVNQTFDIIKTCKSVNLFLDNDEAGEKTVQEYKSIHQNIKDFSKIIYPQKKDFNNYLINR